MLVGLGPPGRLVKIHLAGAVMVVLRLEAVREAAFERLCMALCHELVLGSTAFLLGALGGQQVTEARRAAHQLALGGQFEALGDRLFGLLHEKSGRKQRVSTPLARGKCRRVDFVKKAAFAARMQLRR